MTTPDEQIRIAYEPPVPQPTHRLWDFKWVRYSTWSHYGNTEHKKVEDEGVTRITAPNLNAAVKRFTELKGSIFTVRSVHEVTPPPEKGGE